MSSMRTGADYRESLRDGRRVWILGEGLIDDVTTHPATQPMVDEYVAWYDRHFDPKWQDTVLMPPDEGGVRRPVGYLVPRSADDLRRMGRCFSATTFPSAGNITHTPAYGHLIALGVLHAVGLGKAQPEQVANAEAYRAEIARTGRFLTFAAGAATIGYRLRDDPAQRAALRIVGQSDAGVVIRGKIGMLTSPAFAEDVYVGAVNGVDLDGQRATFVVPVNAPGVTVICRKASARAANPFSAPLSSRYDELDGQMWFDDVAVPWNRVFLTEPSPEPVARWLFWHQLYCWLAKAEFTLGLALACTQAMGLAAHEPTIEYLLDLVTDVQTVRSCQTATELDPEFTAEGYCSPNHGHLAAGSLAMLKARRRMAEILRILPGSSLVVAPTDRDLADPALAGGLEESFAGGGYSAMQRAALLQMAWDHVGSALDHREHVFELHANGGEFAWRGRLRRRFDRYNELANGVLQGLSVAMPEIDLEFDPQCAAGGATTGEPDGASVDVGDGLLRAQKLLAQMAARGRRRIFRRVGCVGAARQAGHRRVVVGVLEEHHRLAAALGGAIKRRIDDAMQGRHPAVVGPARQHVADIDDEAAGQMRHVEPRAVLALHLQAARPVLGLEDGEAAIVAVRPGAQLPRLGRLGRRRIVAHAQPADRAIDARVEVALGQVEGQREQTHEVDRERVHDAVVAFIDSPQPLRPRGPEVSGEMPAGRRHRVVGRVRDIDRADHQALVQISPPGHRRRGCAPGPRPSSACSRASRRARAGRCASSPRAADRRRSG